MAWERWQGDQGAHLRVGIGGITAITLGATVVGKAWRRGKPEPTAVSLPGSVESIDLTTNSAIITVDTDAWLATAVAGDWLVNFVVEGRTFPEDTKPGTVKVGARP